MSADEAGIERAVQTLRAMLRDEDTSHLAHIMVWVGLKPGQATADVATVGATTQHILIAADALLRQAVDLLVSAGSDTNHIVRARAELGVAGLEDWQTALDEPPAGTA